MSPATSVNPWVLTGALFELLEEREQALARVSAVRDLAAGGNFEAEAELEAIEHGITQFVAQQLRDVDGLRAPLKALEQGVALNKADAAAATNRAMILQNRYDRLKDLIKQCMVALDQAGEWKPKQTRKFESARGSFTLRGNGGAQPVVVTDEALVPDEYCRVTVAMTANQWRNLLAAAQITSVGKWLAPELWTPSARVTREASLSAIAEALNADCPRCRGVGAPWNNSSSVACSECQGTGKQSVPGCRLAERGSSVVVK